jgi:hypothetical protein
MPFQKNNKLGAKKLIKAILDDQPICFRGRLGQKDQLKAVPNWQEQLRDFVEELINQETRT